MDDKSGGKTFSRFRHSAYYTVIAALAVLLLLGGRWFRQAPQLFEGTEFLMDTAVTLKVFAVKEQQGRQAMKKAFDEAARIEKIMESRKGDGELQKINLNPGDSWWTISEDLKNVLERSRFFYERTHGAFDPTIAAVKWLWDFENEGDVPKENEIEEKLASVGFSGIDIQGNRLRFTRPEIRLDLGGVAKGYAVDRMIDVLRENGIESGLVNAGGDIATFGKKPGGKNWSIGISHPRLSRTIRVKPINLGAVATSGDYQRFFMKDGKRYHHILDPLTGYPARGCISVTIWASNAMDADILATSIFVLGYDIGLKLAESLDNVETLIFYETDGTLKTVQSTGIKDTIKL